MRYEDQPAQMTQPEAALAATPGPAPTPTPRPTLMPMTLTPQEGQWLATVTEIDDDSSLNLRSTPDLGGRNPHASLQRPAAAGTGALPAGGMGQGAHGCGGSYVVEEYLTAETP